jgi:hypothetical protein
MARCSGAIVRLLVQARPSHTFVVSVAGITGAVHSMLARGVRRRSCAQGFSLAQRASAGNRVPSPMRPLAALHATQHMRKHMRGAE